MYLHPYQASWKQEYVFESELIKQVYKEEIRLIHIGSTAVEGLYAKDCIDILGVVKDIRSVSDQANGLIQMGYDYREENGIPGRAYFSKSSRKVHLHIFQEGHVEIKKHMQVVCLLNKNPVLKQQLNALKQKLYKKHPNNQKAYQAEKKFFYDAIHKQDFEVSNNH